MSRVVRVVAVVAMAAVTGGLVALMIPRGPVTAVQALVVLVGGFALGVAAGVCLHSRWAMLLTPVVHVIAIEIGRLGIQVPTVAAIRLDDAFGILALVLGRGFHGLVSLVPMVLGSALGAALGRPRSGSAWLAAATGVILAVLIGALVWPASTPPILGPDGQTLPGSIAELTRVRLGDHEQGLLIRGYNVDNPVLLYLSGGPGQSDLAFPRVLFSDLERDLTVVSWDQRGTGTSYAALDPISTLTLDRAISDTIELTEYLCRRFDEKRIYLLGESWGSTLAVLAAQRRPDLYYAVVGSGQMVSQLETDRRLYRAVLEHAGQIGDPELAARMLSYGEPPYPDVFGYSFVMSLYDALAGSYTPPAAYVERGGAANLGSFGINASEYNLVDKVNVMRGLIDMFSVMYPQLQGIDFRRDVTRLDVPMYVILGDHELAARSDLAREWFDALQLPRKQLATFPNTGHAPAFEDFESFHRMMMETVLPETYQRQGG